jgi:precorrin-6B methylase 2
MNANKLFAKNAASPNRENSFKETMMHNPWLHIPASDYEGHMSSPHIAQQQFLAQTFQETLNTYDSRFIAYLGCTTGNGLEFVNSDVTKQVTAIDLNPKYLEIVRQRYEHRVAGLEVVEANLETCVLKESAYSLIFAGLLFEYVAPEILLPKIASWLQINGVLVAVLQLPAKKSANVSESQYESLKTLAPIMELRPPAHFKTIAADGGLRQTEARIVNLASGKSFFIGTYIKDRA